MSERLWLVRLRGTVILFIVFLAGLVAGIFFRHRQPATKRPYLMAAFLGVGAGDCTLIRTPHGHFILIDTGPASAGPALAQALHQQKVTTVDLLVLTSTNPSSIGGLPAFLDSKVTVKQIWRGPAAVSVALNGLTAPGAAFAGSVFAEDGATLKALWPLHANGPGSPAALACRLDFGSEGFVLAAPLSAQASRHLVADVGDRLRCDILLVPAGGVDGATTPELLRQAQPSDAVISCGKPPGALTLQRLDAAGAVIYRTDQNGAVTVFTDGVSAPIIKDSGYQ